MKNRFSLSDFEDTIREVLESGGEFRMYPRGVSMLPLLVQDRDSVVLVKPKGDLKVNDIAFFVRDDGSYVLHRVLKAENGNYTLCGDHQIWLETGVENRHIIGVVSKIYRKDKLITPDQKLYKLYLFIWQSFFIRRAYFKLVRIFHKLRRPKNGN